MSSKLMCSW